MVLSRDEKACRPHDIGTELPQSMIIIWSEIRVTGSKQADSDAFLIQMDYWVQRQSFRVCSCLDERPQAVPNPVLPT